jgi:hydrogenase nickel incorporation protein HypA/HybF
MHELSIAQDILSIIKQNVPHEELKNIQNVNVKIGDMAGVVPDSLEFSFQAITSETEMKDARLVIEKIPFVLECNSCKKNSTNEIGIRICSHCGSQDTAVISGLEMQVVDIELNEVNSEV